MRLFRFDWPVVILVVALLLLLVMPSSQSLWMDEAATARLASKPTFQEWQSEMTTGHYSEHQMPFSMAFAWLMAKLLGTSEWQLRATNLVWGALAVFAFYRAGQKLAITWLPLLLVLNPFFWYYMNEARPYAMQIACGAWLFYSLLIFIQKRGNGNEWVVSFALAGFILCGSSLLGVIPFACIALVMFWIGVQNRYHVQHTAWAYLASCILLLLPLGLFYAWTLTKHAGGSKLWPVSYKNVAFAFYELAGFTGLGPGREVLRNAALQSNETLITTFLPYLPALALLGIVYFCVCGILWSRRNENQHKTIVIGSSLVVISTLGATLLLGLVAHWPFWGRHLATILPFALVVMAVGLKLAWTQGIFGKAIGVVFFLLLIISSLEQRFGTAHAKDDYRSAAAVARSAIQSGRRIWWVAGVYTGTYYQVPFDNSRAIAAEDWNEIDLSQLTTPDLIVYSKPDVYDGQGRIGKYLREHDFKVTRVLPAFQIFERPPVPH